MDKNTAQLAKKSSKKTTVAAKAGKNKKSTEVALVKQKRARDSSFSVSNDVHQGQGLDAEEAKQLLVALAALRRGDFSARLPIEWEGMRGKIADVFNDVIEQNEKLARELERLSRVVGKEGIITERASIGEVSGAWAGTVASVNRLVSDLVHPTSETARVIGAVAKGDLSQTMALDVGGRPLQGEFLRTATTVNRMVDQLGSFASEVTRVAVEVGTEGKLGGQAKVKGVAGTWKDLTDSVNSMAGNLTAQVRNIATVTTAVANGDLSKKITVDVKGEILELKNTINTMVDQLNSFASEVTRVAREVGTEGKLGGQAEVKGVAGTWKDLTDNVNSMAGNLTAQVRNIATVTTAVANGDLSKKITVDVKGEILELKNTINTMVDQLNSFASEVTRVAREVGTEGKLGGQAEVKGVAGTWKDLTDNVNSMAGNLTAQVRNIATVTTAVANGDLSKKITVDVKGEILELKNTINTMVDQLSSFASEVTRVAREVGTEGKLGGQAEVKGVAGTWKDLTDNVNSMAGNLTAQVRNIATVTTAVANGDLSKKITVDVKGEILELKNTINTMVDQLNSFASEVTRVAREVGTEGKLGGQADVKGVAGTWKDLTDNVNFMASNLTVQLRDMSKVATAIANGDLTQKITVDVRGEILQIKNVINTMVDQLSSFAAEVTRVAREVGTEGKLGGQAQVKGVAGTWKDLTDNVNSMAGNLTNQVRGIANLVTAIAHGDLKRKLAVDAKGEIAALADTINGMIDTLATFADQVTTVAREVGVEGKLGGQASVPGAAGTWRDLTDNVNRLAANLTTQVRAIAEVATAVTKGDLTRSIKVEAQGEVAALKDNINEMIRNLKDTTLKNSEQDWLKTNLAKFSRMLQGQKDLLTVGRLILSELAPVVSAQQGVFYTMDTSKDEAILKLLASYAYRERKNMLNQFKLGEGLVGQCALEKEKILLLNVPRDYITITSGLGEAPPLNIIVIPVLFEGHVKAVLELASFERLNPTHQTFLDQLAESIGIVLNTIEANTRTEDLLKQSQSLARELQSQQEELQETNAALGEKARLLAEQNVEVERKNHEVEQARQALEEKARQLALTSKYKSEFLANMSHELRTPLNSLLILSDQLSRNPENNLTGRQVDFAKTIHSAGNDLLALINDILDLSKIESGTVNVELDDVWFSDLTDYVERTFRHVADAKRLSFSISIGKDLPNVMQTDAKRLQQVLKNLLSNAFKFTERGGVVLEIMPVASGWSVDNEGLNASRGVVAMSVRDTGIGIQPDKQQIIFEAFQQADGSTSRKYGGTGLGLAISRELAQLLGGEIKLVSVPGKGSTFTLLLPIAPAHASQRPRARTISGEMAIPAKLLGPGGSSEESGRGAENEGSRNRSNGDAPPPMRMETNHFTSRHVDDRDSLRPDDSIVLIVEDDAKFAQLLRDTAHDNGFRAVIAASGGIALTMMRDIKPHCIILDIFLPDIDGWGVLERVKEDVATRHIPVEIISTGDERMRGLRMGASGVLAKPVKTRETIDAVFTRLRMLFGTTKRAIAVVEGDDARRRELIEVLGGDDVTIHEFANGADAYAKAKATSLEAMVIGMTVSDMRGYELAELIERDSAVHELPLIAYAPEQLPNIDETNLLRMSRTRVLHYVRSIDHLYDAVSLVIHRPVSAMPPERRAAVERMHQINAVLAQRKVLIVDDDIRNIFALTTLLEPHGMTIISAETGKAAIEALESAPDIDIALMDIMMPEMDGYDTMRAIRARERFRALPIIALTAKAMKGDREKCIEAGATDYISKPVDVEHLLAILRIWLHRGLSQPESGGY